MARALATQLPVGSVFAGHRIEGIAGSGGMGVVYRATDLGLKRLVALKLLLPEYSEDESFRRRFKRESELAASIRHPHVITIFQAGEESGLLYIAMEYIEGTDLGELISREGRLPPPLAADIVSQLASALDVAHARGLVHRDVKPANVLLSGEGDQSHAYLTDFGLMKRSASESGLTKTGMFVGTLDYIAPEQLQGSGIDARADVYSLGCVLFEALTGVVPYSRDSDPAKIWAHMQADPPPPTAVAPDLSPRFDAVVARALAKEPSERYPSAGDLARATEAAGQGRAPGAPERSVAEGAAAPERATVAPQEPEPPPTRVDREPTPAPPSPATPESPTQAPPGGPTRPPSPQPPGDLKLGSWLRRNRVLVAAGAGFLALVVLLVALVAGGLLSSEDPRVEVRKQVAAWAGSSSPEEECALYSGSYFREQFRGGESACRRRLAGKPFDAQTVDTDRVSVSGSLARAAGSYRDTGDRFRLGLEREDDQWLISRIVYDEREVRDRVKGYADSVGEKNCDFFSRGYLADGFEGGRRGCRRELADATTSTIDIRSIKVDKAGARATVKANDGDPVRIPLVREGEPREWYIDNYIPEYPQEVRDNFVRSCNAEPGATRQRCVCTVDKLEETVSYEDFKRYDRAIRTGERVDLGIKGVADVKEALTSATEACAQ